jgi:hypothetical protein
MLGEQTGIIRVILGSHPTWRVEDALVELYRTVNARFPALGRRERKVDGSGDFACG